MEAKLDEWLLRNAKMGAELDRLIGDAEQSGVDPIIVTQMRDTRADLSQSYHTGYRAWWNLSHQRPAVEEE